MHNFIAILICLQTIYILQALVFATLVVQANGNHPGRVVRDFHSNTNPLVRMCHRGPCHPRWVWQAWIKQKLFCKLCRLHCRARKFPFVYAILLQANGFALFPVKLPLSELSNCKNDKSVFIWRENVNFPKISLVCDNLFWRTVSGWSVYHLFCHHRSGICTLPVAISSDISCDFEIEVSTRWTSSSQ